MKLLQRNQIHLYQLNKNNKIDCIPFNSVYYSIPPFIGVSKMLSIVEKVLISFIRGSHSGIIYSTGNCGITEDGGCKLGCKFGKFGKFGGGGNGIGTTL